MADFDTCTRCRTVLAPGQPTCARCGARTDQPDPPTDQTTLPDPPTDQTTPLPAATPTDPPPATDAPGGARLAAVPASSPAPPGAAPAGPGSMPSPFVTPQLPGPRTFLVAGLAFVTLLVTCGGLLGVQQFFYTPEAAIRGYFSALADRDATAALRYVRHGSLKGYGLDRKLLSDRVLGSRHYVPPSDVESKPIRSYVSDDAPRNYLIRYRIGDQRHVERIMVRRDDRSTLGVFRRWRLVGGGALLRLTAPPGSAVRVNGVPAPRTKPRSQKPRLPLVFPGRYRVALAKDALLTADAETVDIGMRTGRVKLDVRLKTSAREDAEEAVNAYLDKCAESTELEPPSCPFSTYSYVEVTDVEWSIQTYPEITIDLNPIGQVKVRTDDYGVASVTAKNSDGDTLRAEAIFYVRGTITAPNNKITFHPAT